MHCSKQMVMEHRIASTILWEKLWIVTIGDTCNHKRKKNASVMVAEPRNIEGALRTFASVSTLTCKTELNIESYHMYLC
jgi:hypothetical protein